MANLLFKTSIELLETGNTENAFTCVNPEYASGYKILCALKLDGTDESEERTRAIGSIAAAFAIFEAYTINGKPSFIITEIRDENGEVGNWTGVCLNNDCELWSVAVAEHISTALFNCYGNTNSLVRVPIHDEDEFATWLSLTPTRFAFQNDIILIPLDNNILDKATNPKCRKYFNTYRAGRTYIIPFMIRDISSTNILLQPYGDLAYLINISLPFTMTEFQEHILVGHFEMMSISVVNDIGQNVLKEIQGEK